MSDASYDITAEDERKVNAMIAAADLSYRRVLKAEWVPEPYAFYSMDLECGHNVRHDEQLLRSHVMCIPCVTALLPQPEVE